MGCVSIKLSLASLFPEYIEYHRYDYTDDYPRCDGEVEAEILPLYVYVARETAYIFTYKGDLRDEEQYQADGPYDDPKGDKPLGKMIKLSSHVYSPLL